MELIRTEMTPRERLTAYAAGQEVDRIPTVSKTRIIISLPT